MKTVVTGGTGFAGSHLVRRLLGQGHEVTSLDLRPGEVDEELRAAGARLIQGSVTDPAAVREATAGAEVVFHLASAFRDIHAPDEHYWNVDVIGTRTVLEAARDAGVRRVVHCSTQGVHGTLARTPGDENSPIAPRDYYCYAKYEAEKVCEEFIASGMDVVIVRATSIYGPGDTHGWLKLFRMINKGRFVMIGSGKTYNHPVYVENLVDAFVLAAETPEARGRIYLAGDDRAVTLNELVEAVAATLGVQVRILRFPWYRGAWYLASVAELVSRPLKIEPLIFRRRLTWFSTNRAFSIAKAQQELGYRPAVSLAEGLARTAAWYRERGLL